MAMEVLKELYVLIDYVGHPSMNDDYLNKKRLDTLNLLLRTKTSKTIISIGSEFGNRKQNWKYFTRYHEMFEEIKSFAYRRSNIIWIDLIDDPSFQVLTDELSNKNYTIVNSLLKGTSERPEVKIDWRVYTKNPENPLIRDLIIEGLSLARTQKEEFASILNSNDNDINALFNTLEEFSKN